jgi:cobyric acid synthase
MATKETTDLQVLVDLKGMDKTIQDIKQKAQHLIEISGGMQCVDRNVERILTSVKMLELNISDVVEFLD